MPILSSPFATIIGTVFDVSGEGSVEVVPDVAKTSFGITVSRPTVAAATAAGANLGGNWPSQAKSRENRA